MTSPVKQVDPWIVDYLALEERADRDTGDESEDSFHIGRRDGFSEAVAIIDVLTGGDGEYRFCTNKDPERHTPDPPAMIARIVERTTRHRENETRELREALEQIELLSTNHGGWFEQDAWKWGQMMGDEARKALHKGQTDE